MPLRLATLLNFAAGPALATGFHFVEIPANGDMPSIEATVWHPSDADTPKACFDAGLAVRYGDRAAEERQAAGKDTGTVRFDDGDFTIVADLPKRLDRDQDKLAAMVARMLARGAGDGAARHDRHPERDTRARERRQFDTGQTVTV